MENLKVAVEVRARIRTCHFFVNNISEPKSVKVSEPNIISIEYAKNNVIKIGVEDLNLVTDSITSLQIREDSLYFQARSKPDILHGSFHCELLVNNKSECDETKTLSEVYKPDFERGSPIKLFCRCCSAPLLHDEVIFDRILPLPSSEGCDFFCHGSMGCIDLNPKPADCLYGNFYFRINPSSVRNKSIGIMYCEKCGSWIGTRDDFSATFWHSGIKTDISDNDKVNEQALEDFVSLIKSFIKKEGRVTCKIILNSKFNDDENHYLLLWVMDSNLTLFIDHVLVKGKITLKETKVAKVLYSYEQTETDIVKQWKEDVSVNEGEISKPMLVEGLRLLEDMSLLIPHDFRKANQLSVSYIK